MCCLYRKRYDLRHTFQQLRAVPACAVLATPNNAPKQRRKTNGLPGEVWRQSEEPGNPVASTNLATYGAKEIAKSMSAVRSEYLITDQIDADREEHQPDEEQAEEQTYLAERDLSEGIFFFRHVLDAHMPIVKSGVSLPTAG